MRTVTTIQERGGQSGPTGEWDGWEEEEGMGTEPGQALDAAGRHPLGVRAFLGGPGVRTESPSWG